MRSAPFAFAVVLSMLAATACQGAPATAMPEGEGRGLVASDDTPPPGATTYERPTWHEGDRFTLLRGERVAGTFAVVAIDEQGYVLDYDGQVHMRRDLDLGNLGEWTTDGKAPRHLLTPVDVRYRWPLWVGKRWSCEFVDRLVDGPAMSMQARYEVEDLDTVTVPAGTFAALRIVRSLRRLDLPDATPTRTQIVWYAPAVGLEVRQLLGDSVVDLVSLERGGS